MKNYKNILSSSSLLEKILLLAPIFIWFSYAPNFHLGRGDGMNFEFSLTMIYVVVLALIALPRIWARRNFLLKNRSVWLVSLFVLWNIISIIWSTNTPRAVLTSGVLGVLWLDFLGIMTLDWRRIWPTFKRNYIYMAVLMSILAVIQVVYGTWIDTGLCAGCLARGFGFVRPSVFAIEPQFFGSLLIAPIILVIYDIVVKQAKKHNFIHLFLMLIAMYLTLSRGAIFALMIALTVMIVVIITTKVASLKRTLGITVAMVGLSFVAGLFVHAIFTQLNPRVSDGFYDSISKSISQMSLGRINLQGDKREAAGESSNADSSLNPAEKPGDEIKVDGLTESIQGEVGEQNSPDDAYVAPGLIVETESDTTNTLETEDSGAAMFDGYVARSTDERTALSSLAIKTWQKDWRTMLFGVGVGSAGKAIYDYTGATGWEYEIVQNQFLEILLELGLVGLAIFVLIILGFIAATRYRIAFVAILIAFLVQWNFFSGLPNALHIYLILAVLFATIKGAYEKESDLNRRIYTAQ